MGLLVATKAFFKLLANRELSDSFEKMLEGQKTGKLETPKPSVAKPTATPSPAPPTRSDAISLLAALQREARLLDLVQEPLEGFSDSQVGAAARDVLKNSGKVLERMFGLEPMTQVTDGGQLKTPPTFDPAEYRLTGAVSGKPPFSGTVAHHGWKATRCDVPQWSGSSKTALIVAPVELEIQ